MKRRDFLMASGTVAGALLPAWARGQALPCPPPAVSVAGGASAAYSCGTTAPTVVSGTVTLVGSNTLYDLIAANPARFSGWPTYALGYATGGAYGAGTYVPGYGAKGAYVVCMSSGDSAPQVSDAVIFDFDSLTWKLQVNADGVPNSLGTTWCTSASGHPASTDGGPYYEMAGKPGVPHPGQLYRLAVGVGSRFIRTLGSYMGGDIKTAPYTHQYDLATARYSRISGDATAALSYFNWAAEPAALYDARANRIWVLVEEMGSVNHLAYLDLNDNTWKSSPTYPVPPTTGATANWQHSLLHDDGKRRCILTFKATSYQGGTYPNYARVLDLDNISAGWQNVTLSGPTTQFQYPGAGPYTESHSVRWAQYPVDNCHYTFDGFGSQISKITPPASGITGTWTISLITPASGTLPAQMQGGGASEGAAAYLSHYTRFMYVPPLACFAWIAAGTRKVALWKP